MTPEEIDIILADPNLLPAQREALESLRRQCPAAASEGGEDYEENPVFMEPSHGTFDFSTSETVTGMTPHPRSPRLQKRFLMGLRLSRIGLWLRSIGHPPTFSCIGCHAAEANPIDAAEASYATERGRAFDDSRIDSPHEGERANPAFEYRPFEPYPSAFCLDKDRPTNASLLFATVNLTIRGIDLGNPKEQRPQGFGESGIILLCIGQWWVKFLEREFEKRLKQWVCFFRDNHLVELVQHHRKVWNWTNVQSSPC